MIPDPGANLQNGHARDGDVQACKVLLPPRVVPEVSVRTEVQDRINAGDDAIACSSHDPSWERAQQGILLSWFRQQGTKRRRAKESLTLNVLL